VTQGSLLMRLAVAGFRSISATPWSTLLARSSEASAASRSAALRSPIFRAACASLSAAFSRHWYAVKIVAGSDPQYRRAVWSKQTTSQTIRAAGWCDQNPTPAENPLYSYSGHSCAHRRPHGSGKLFIDRHQTKLGAVMSIIPLDLQRRCERRWDTRFSRPVPSAAPRYQRPVRESPQIASSAKSEEPAAPIRQA
jgi:hypothetical protein